MNIYIAILISREVQSELDSSASWLLPPNIININLSLNVYLSLYAIYLGRYNQSQIHQLAGFCLQTTQISIYLSLYTLCISFYLGKYNQSQIHQLAGCYLQTTQRLQLAPRRVQKPLIFLQIIEKFYEKGIYYVNYIFYTTITNKNLDKTKMVTNLETHRAQSQSSMEC